MRCRPTVVARMLAVLVVLMQLAAADAQPTIAALPSVLPSVLPSSLPSAPFAPPFALQRATLPRAVLAPLQAGGGGPGDIAIAALPLHQDGVPWLYRADQPMQPASTMKLVTSIVALDRLTPNFRGFTELRSAAPLVGGVLQGALVLKGGADPDLGVPQLWALLLDLRQAGVQAIDGDLILDRTLFRPARSDVGLPPFDEAPEFPYNVIPDALNLAGNLLPLQLQSDATGSLRAATVPPLPGIVFDTSAVQRSSRACKNWDDDWLPATTAALPDGSTRIALHGAYPPNCTQRPQLQLVDRLELAERLVRTLWLQLGGTWAGRAVEGAAPDGTRLLARRNSRTWGEVLRSMNKTSDNPHTRLLFLQLGAAASMFNPTTNSTADPAADPTAPDAKTATTAELAARAVRSWMQQHGIDPSGLVLDNGSGLSRSERITPLQLAAMLRVAAAGPHASDLLMSLPVAGVDGTMRNRLQQSPATGWARLKTGTLNNTTALAGYVTDAQGRPWAVAMMVNRPEAARALPALDAMVEHIVRVGLPAPPRVVGPLGEGP